MITTLQYLDFEDDIKSLDLQMKELEKLSLQKGISYSSEVRKLQKKRVVVLQKTYNNLTAWQTVQIARHPQRPIFQDYLKNIFHEFVELRGDRCFRDDRAIVTGLGKIGREKVLVIGHNKGKTTEENIKRNFGCPHPEGYRKALVKMKFAEKFKLPIITFIDTPGAYPGVEAEERGQGPAIARNLIEMSKLKVPIISIIIGEGGSGGALGIGVGDRLFMLKYSYYSVISPEGCAAILWRDGSYAEEAAKALKITSTDLKRMKLIDGIIDEPLGGAHRSFHDTFDNVKSYILRTLRNLKKNKITTLLNRRYKRLRSTGNSFHKK